MEEAFPPEQRRDRLEYERLFATSSFRLLTAEEECVPVGSLLVWELPSFIFLETFAVKSSYRGHGIGTQLLEFASGQWSKPQLLEAEPPETAAAARRIAYYERFGYLLNDWNYWMPPMRRGEAPERLKLLSKPAILSREQAERAIAAVYCVVYAGKPHPPIRV